MFTTIITPRRFSSLFIALALVLAFSLNAEARPDSGFTGPGTTAGSTMQQGGFSGPGPALSSVQNAKSMADDSWVTLKGHILQYNGDKRYTFQDATGSIQVKIGHKAWRGLNVGPNDLVELHGEVDKDWNDLHIDVKQVLKAQ